MTIGCAEAPPSITHTPNVEEIRALVQAAIGPPYQHPNGALILSWDTSAVVPGLAYVVGAEPTTSIPSNSRSAMIAIRHGVARALLRPRDWAKAAAGWTPPSEESAVDACTEFIFTSVEGIGPHIIIGDRTEADSTAPWVYEYPIRNQAASQGVRPPVRPARGRNAPLAPPGTPPEGRFRPLYRVPVVFLSDSATALFRRHRALFTSPRAVVDTHGNWTVSLWTLRERGPAAYRCHFPTSRFSPRTGATIVATDSMTWPAPTLPRH